MWQAAAQDVWGCVVGAVHIQVGHVATVQGQAKKWVRANTSLHDTWSLCLVVSHPPGGNNAQWLPAGAFSSPVARATPCPETHASIHSKLSCHGTLSPTPVEHAPGTTNLPRHPVCPPVFPATHQHPEGVLVHLRPCTWEVTVKAQPT